jgi:hypothetical protein
MLQANRSDVRLISGYLEENGFTQLSENVLHGNHALVFEANDGQMIRVVHCDVEREVRPDSPFVLQPVVSLDELENYRIEVLPKVITLKDLSDQDAIRLRTQLIADMQEHGLIANDARYENIAVVYNKAGEAVPLVLDPASVFDYRKQPDKLAAAIAADAYFDDDVAEKSTHSPEYYAAAQAAHLESLGLEQGKIKRHNVSDIPQSFAGADGSAFAYSPVKTQFVVGG